MITHVGWKRAWREKCDPQRTSSWNWGVASGHRRRDVRQCWRRPSELPLIEEILDPKEVEKAPGPWRLIGAEVSEQLDYEPRRFLRQRLVRHTYVRRGSAQQFPRAAGLWGRVASIPKASGLLVSLSPNWMANWVAAVLQVTGGFFHCLVMFRKTR